ncbi:MAG: hypothetical protein RL318_2644 [Fibrobacterota bacterium]|jgi:hypothetical protein
MTNSVKTNTTKETNMKKISRFASAGACIATLGSAAPQINLQVRTDYRYDFRNGADSTLKDNSGFDMQFARLDLNGSMESGLKYRMRLKFDFPSQAASVNPTTGAGTAVVKDTLKGSADYVDYAYFKQPLPSGFAVTAGKFFSGRAGYEGLAAGSDHYLTTLVYASSGAFHSVLGVQPAWEGFGQTVSLTLANSGTGWKTDKGVQHFLMVGGLWQGTFLGGMVQPHVSYYLLPKKAVDDGLHLATLGVKSKVEKITSELEWKSLTDTANTKGNNAFTHSTSLLVKADFGMLRPQMKLFYDNKSVLDEKKSLERVGVSPVLEVFPYEKTNLRWHVGYAYVDEIPKGKADRSWNKVFVGAAMNLDIFK